MTRRAEMRKEPPGSEVGFPQDVSTWITPQSGEEDQGLTLIKVKGKNSRGGYLNAYDMERREKLGHRPLQGYRGRQREKAI